MSSSWRELEQLHPAELGALREDVRAQCLAAEMDFQMQLIGQTSWTWSQSLERPEGGYFHILSSVPSETRSHSISACPAPLNSWAGQYLWRVYWPPNSQKQGRHPLADGQVSWGVTFAWPFGTLSH